MYQLRTDIVQFHSTGVAWAMDSFGTFVGTYIAVGFLSVPEHLSGEFEGFLSKHLYSIVSIFKTNTGKGTHGMNI